MHLTMSRPTPYTVPPSLHMLQRQAAVGYGVAFTADHCSSEAAGTAAAAGYTFTPTQAYGSTPQYQANYGSNSSCSYQSSPLYNADSPSAADETSYVASGSTVLCNPPSPSDTTAFSPSSSNGATSPSHHTQSPQLNGDCSVQSPLKSYCQYSSPMQSMSSDYSTPYAGLSLPQSSSVYSLPQSSSSVYPLPQSSSSVYPLPQSSSSVYPLPQSSSSVYPLPQSSSSVYPLPDYHSQYSTPLGFSSNPSFSLWNYQPVGQYPKVSYDTPRYKLTPERALPLMKWFEDHKDHPYPSRCEKMLLCQSTLLTFTQVSTWFANARRRMKKAAQEDEEEEEDSSEESCGSDKETAPSQTQ